MIAYLKVRKALRDLEAFISSEHFPCTVDDANTCIFRTSSLYAYVKVRTDAEKCALQEDPQVMRKYREALQMAGIPMEGDAVNLRIESQETVNRDWDGNWFYALFK